MLYNYRQIFKKSVGVHDLVVELSKLLRFVHLGSANISNNPINNKLRKSQPRKVTELKYMGLGVHLESLLPSSAHRTHLLDPIVAAAAK